MKTWVKVLCVVFVCGVTVKASDSNTKVQSQEDHCSFDFVNAKSAFDQNSKDFISVRKISRNEKDKVLRQRAILKNGKIKVDFTTGGCAHYSYSFNYYLNIKQKTFTSDEAFKKAVELLKATPTTAEGKAQTTTLIEALEQATMNKIFRPPNSIYDVPCGDAQCSLDASVKRQLKISYSFAL